MKNECCKEDCTREIFEEEVRKFEEKDERDDRCFEDKNCRKIERKCDFEQIYFDINCILVRDKRIIFELCACHDVMLCDGRPIAFKVCPCIPRESCTAPKQVFIKIGKKEMPLTDKIGDYVFDNQVVSREWYYGYYGADPEHVISMNVLRITRW